MENVEIQKKCMFATKQPWNNELSFLD